VEKLMKNFKTKTLVAAFAGLSAAGAVGVAEAVYLNPDGLGQVLIYPYYTVRDKASVAPFDTYLSVVNTTNSAKAVKVRFIEGKNSAEVLDFNLWLSKHDVWVAGVIKTAAGAGVYTPDKSCTVPKVASDPTNPTPFVNFAYVGDGAGDSLDRTREGYIEIIEMGAVTSSTVETSVTHVAGEPPCWTKPSLLADATVSNAVGAPTGGLFGGVTLINVLSGEDFTADAVALDNFRTTGKYDKPGDIKPDLRDVSTEAQIINGATIITDDWDIQPVDNVSAILMRSAVYNEFVLDTGTKSTTDWVVTMPTKRYYFDADGVVQYLFQRNFTATGACDDVNALIYDREEQIKSIPPGFSPPPPSGKPGTICWEANVLTFNGGNALASTNNVSLTTDYKNGWMDLSFPVGASSIYMGNYHELPMTNGTFQGLPIIGFGVQTFLNGYLTDPTGKLVQSSYGGNFLHKYKRTYTAAPQ
jgi:hypothetical protein